MKTSRLRMKMLPTKKKHAVSWLRAKSQRRKPPLIEPVPWRELVEPSLSFDISATSARVRMAGKHPADRSSNTTVKNDLESALYIARKCGYLEYEYKLGFSTRRGRTQSGEQWQSRSRLKAIIE
jgi:hypothetical protein